MATVTFPPELCFSVGTSIQEDSGVAYDQTDDGAYGLRDLYARPYFNLSATFSALNQEQQALLTGFLRNNRMAEIVMNLNGTSYTGVVIQPPKLGFNNGGGYAAVTVVFRARLTDA